MFRNLKHLNKIINYSVLSDILMMLFAGVTVVTYNYDKNLSPEYLLFFMQMVVLWFALKTAYRFLPVVKEFILIALLFWISVESVRGLGQLYGYWPSKHSLFKTTGSFFNPGPYGGFIALIFPLVLQYYLIYKHKNKLAQYPVLFAGAVALLVFPATMSRTAWIAALAGCLLVLFSQKSLIVKLHLCLKRNKRRTVLYVLLICTVVLVSGVGIYNMKKDSANGRLFMWKITALAIKESSLTGVGSGGFAAAYGKAQSAYFKSGKGNETEKLVAGSPEYAFNEYLQIFLEKGLQGIVLFLLLSFLIIRSGIRNGHTGAAGSFLTLSFFAFASYPYQLWQFPLIWILLGSVCTATPNGRNKSAALFGRKKRTVFFLMLTALCTVSVSLVPRQKKYHQARKEWQSLQPLYNMKAYERVNNDYAKLYSLLNHNPKFVFEYGMILNGIEQNEKAEQIFARGIEISCDPMFCNVRGRNYHEMRRYEEAEACYVHSTYLLPERIYPYYLLTKLYGDSANYQPKKMRQAAQAVLEKEPKIHSQAIDEMRSEVRKLLTEKEEGEIDEKN